MKKIMTLLFAALIISACSGQKDNVEQNQATTDMHQEQARSAGMEEHAHADNMDSAEEMAAESEEGMMEEAGQEEPAKQERSKTWSPTAETPKEVASEIPVDGDKLFAYLKSKGYQKFTHQEKESHPSQGPHTKFGLPVRVFFNDKIAESIKAGNSEHPEGAGIVKEMYNKDNVLMGWAVMVKTQATADNGKGWFWYEVTNTEDNSFENIPAIGNGVPGCIGCHAIGKDMVRSDFSKL